MNSFSDFVISKGFNVYPICDGEIHRFKTEDDRSKKSGWYVCHYESGVEYGTVGSWRTGESHSWHSTQTDTHELEHVFRNIQNKRKKEQKKKLENGIIEATEIWNNAINADTEHLYLKRKQIPPYSVKIGQDNALIVPYMNIDGYITTIQRIYADGGKRYLSGAVKQGSFCRIGVIKDHVLMCEGYATGASLYMATGITTIIAGDTSGLLPAARAIYGKYDCLITFCADRDRSRAGMTYSNKASKEVDGRVVMCPIFTDFNDLHVQQGLDAVRKSILGL